MVTIESSIAVRTYSTRKFYELGLDGDEVNWLKNCVVKDYIEELQLRAL